MIFQRTVKRKVSLAGVGLHSGKPVDLVIQPGPAHQGVVFVRTDLEGCPRIPAHYKNVVNTQMATTLGYGKAKISTVEHVMAALHGMGIDNATIEVNGPEVPVLDGSSFLFCEAIRSAGIEVQKSIRPVLALRKRVEVKLNEKWAVAEPSSSLQIHGTIDWDHPAIGFQEFTYDEGKTSFYEDLSRARTFGFLKDYEALKKAGLAKGGSLENAVVLDETSVVNPNGLRYPDEFVRHKVLDALGDFKLAGVSIQAFIRLHRAGHDLHYQLLMEVFKNPDHFEIISDEQVERLPTRLQTALASSLIAGL